MLPGHSRRAGSKTCSYSDLQTNVWTQCTSTHFCATGLPQVADWWTCKQNACTKEDITKAIKEALEHDDQPSNVCPNSNFFFLLSEVAEDAGKQVVSAVHAVIKEQPLPEAELVRSLWQGLMAQVDWSTCPDQIKSLALREVSVHCPTSAFLTISINI